MRLTQLINTKTHCIFSIRCCGYYFFSLLVFATIRRWYLFPWYVYIQQQLLDTLSSNHSLSVLLSAMKMSHTQMKGPEVPNPWRSSACDCTYVLTRNRTLSRDSLMLAMRILLLFLPMQSSFTSFWRSFTCLVQLIFSFPS